METSFCTYGGFENKKTQRFRKTLKQLCSKVFVICIANVIPLVRQKYKITQS